MISTEELSELLATLYSAPLEPQKWQSFLDRLCCLTNTASSYMLGVHPEYGNVTLAGGGLDFNPETMRLYNEHYGASDPYAAPALAKPRVGIVQAEELVSRANLHRSELYNEVLHPYHLEYMILLSCGNLKEFGVFPLWRSPEQGPWDTASIHLIKTLLPHLQTALRLRTKVIACNASELFSETALDTMSIAAFLVNSKGHIRHMNHLAASHLETAQCLRLHKGKLVSNEPPAPPTLEQLIAQATSSSGHSLVNAPGGSLKLSHFNVTVVPAPERNGISGSESYALVFVTDPRTPAKSRALVMRQLYGLTPSEARVADHLLDGFEVRDAAAQLDITLETCRFHIKRVLAKTGTRRQSELIRLMLSLPGQ